jgi:hypothetical protein
MFGIIPIACEVIVLCVIVMFLTDKSYDISDKIAALLASQVVGFFLLVIISGISSGVIGWLVKDNVITAEYKGKWNIRASKPGMQFTGSGRTLSGAQVFNVLADYGEGKLKVISFPFDTTTIREVEGEQPCVMRYDDITTSKSQKIWIGPEVTNEKVRYELIIPKGSVVEQFLVM